VTVVAIVPAAGSGARLGAAVPKAFVAVAGRALLVHAIDRLLAAGVDRVVVAVSPDQLDAARRLVGDRSTLVSGGVDRTASVAAALRAAAADADVILVHDAARAFAPASLIRSVAAAVRGGAPAVVPVLPVVDTIRTVSRDGALGGTVDRDRLRVVQTPQGFDPTVLRRAHLTAAADGRSASDDAGLVESLGIPVSAIAGSAASLSSANG